MRYKLLIMSVLTAILAVLPADARRFSFGVEGSSSYNFASYNNTAYRTDVGYRVYDKSVYREIQPISEVLAMATANINPFWRISMLSGYSGLEPGLRTVPIEVRAMYVFANMTPSGGGFFFQAGAGTAIPLEKPFRAGALVRGGFGYSFAVTTTTHINFGFTYRLIYYKPNILDPDTDEIISSDNVMRADRFVSAFCFSLAIEI